MNFYHMTHGYSNHYARAKGRIGKYERHPCEVCEANHIIDLENTREKACGLLLGARTSYNIAQISATA